MKNHLLAVLATLVLPSLAPAQSLTYFHTTLGNDPASHLRSPAWQPLFADWLRARTNQIVIHYDVTITNTSTFGTTFYSITGFGAAPYIHGGRNAADEPCWGLDEGPPDFVFQVDLGTGPTLLPGETRRFTGTGIASGVVWSGAPSAGGGCVEDGLHSTQATDLAMGPRVGTPVLQWQVGATPGLFDCVDHGSTVASNLFIVRAEYSLPPTGWITCTPLQPNSTGSTGELHAFGQALAAAGETLLVLEASAVPSGEFGFFLLSRSGAPALPLAGGGTLCLGGHLVRWLDSLTQIDASGSLVQRLDPSALPAAIGVPMPGTTMFAQFWHRDLIAGMPTSNTTSAAAITFQ